GHHHGNEGHHVGHEDANHEGHHVGHHEGHEDVHHEGHHDAIHHELQDEHHDDYAEMEHQSGVAESSVGPGSKRRKKRPYKKAPDAPRRGRSAYVLFSMHKRDDVKASLPEGSKVTEIMKGIAAKWRELTNEDKSVWINKAAEDKKRYEHELSVYDGPLKVPNKRARKDPLAPKRAMSAFLHFSQAMRPRLREQYPEAKNVDMSKMLGQEWNRMSDSEKSPYQAKAAEDTGRYRVAMDLWKQGEAAEGMYISEW
ncbi:unnamed protein product, partial [Choristocarpus tenellus]